MTGLHDLDARAQAEALRDGGLSARELAAHYISRIDALDDGVGAFVVWGWRVSRDGVGGVCAVRGVR